MRGLARRRSKEDTIPNQVFIGAPWSVTRPKYERAIAKLKKKFPLSFVIVGRGDGQEAEDLLAVIKKKIDLSSFVVFDATGGNANVSLDFGYAEALGLKRALYVSTHQAAKRARKDNPIIADLAGKKHNQYKQEGSLVRLLSDLCKIHDYTKRFENFLTTSFHTAKPGQKKRWRAMALKYIHLLDGQESIRRVDSVQSLQAEGYRGSEIDELIRKMRAAGLVHSQQGPHSRVWVT